MIKKLGGSNIFFSESRKKISKLINSFMGTYSCCPQGNSGLGLQFSVSLGFSRH